MKMRIVASTQLTPTDEGMAIDEMGYRRHYTKPNNPSYYLGPKHADELAEAAGRLCYKSFDRPNPKTATNHGYLDNIVAQQHFSVLEHASATFYLEDISRSCSHELVRHRHFSFSQVSQRYVDESKFEFIEPPGLKWATPSVDSTDRSLALSAAAKAYAKVYKQLRENGLSNKEARQAARAYLPGNTATSLLMTGNMRSWREFLQKRLSVHADKEIQLVAKGIMIELCRIAPNTFRDLRKLFRFATISGVELSNLLDPALQ